MRRETYGTSGTRMTVRFFGGYDFTPDDAQSRYLAEAGYSRGVPMGGDLKPAAPGKAPTFLVAALKDPQGANLDRIQVVKGWLDASGKAQEKVYDVVWAGNRKPDKDGKLPPVGDTVDVARATFTNTIGTAELATVWKDPDFRAAPARLLLRARHRDPDPPLDRVRPGALRREDERRRPDEAAGARMDVADLVLADLSRRSASTLAAGSRLRPPPSSKHERVANPRDDRVAARLRRRIDRDHVEARAQVPQVASRQQQVAGGERAATLLVRSRWSRPPDRNHCASVTAPRPSTSTCASGSSMTRSISPARQR